MELVRIIGLFHIAAGVLFVSSVLLFCGGFFSWLVQMGLESRSVGIEYMKEGVQILFSLIVILFGVRIFQTHPALGYILITVVVIGYAAYMIGTDLMTAEPDKKPAAPAPKK